jgi:imidazolonepropionase
LKLKGASYEEVAKAGGGIVNTVDGTRAASVEELVESARPRIQALMAEGVTAIEIKSGYGLNEEEERKMLKAAREVGKLFDIEVRTSFLGAHAVPREYKERGTSGADEYTSEVVRMMSDLKSEGLVDTCDAFCETIGFNVEQTERVFDEASKLGVPVRLHGDQLNDFGGGALVARYEGLSCDHCEYTSQSSVDAMAKAGTAAVLLPTSNYFIKEKQRPPVAAFRKAGVRMALATNCNPGSSPCSSILLVMNMGCTLFGLTPEEALLGVTRHAAQAMGLGASHGTLEVGKVADFALWDVCSPGEISYYLGLNKLVECFRGGRLRKSSRL